MTEALKRWAETYRSRGRYTPVGVAFHWIMAAVVIFQLGSGWWMQRYLAGAEKIEAYQIHSQIGLSLLVIGLLRLLWRTIVPGPINDADKPGVQSAIAHATHAVFYALFTILPLSGWAMWSAIRPAAPLYLAGLVPVPAMPFHDLSRAWQYWILETAIDIHVAAAIVLALLVPAHALAAIKHHLVDRDDVFEGMLPELSDSRHHPGGAQHSPPPLAARDAKGAG
ncbi:cytochrome b [Altererythrobacter aerius]|uniref:Cytochrome b n=1 Tax=Tsuneonella aeria TaxID=1837929 RepID=A0A6I4TEM4_9SPHN|nr:cytochrome b/b6 domain-containing protein [Tsuneonella aeria]MXO76019.1 cytochrome b [Tsuneonella aeria]